jgi:hypothetical protein
MKNDLLYIYISENFNLLITPHRKEYKYFYINKPILVHSPKELISIIGSHKKTYMLSNVIRIISSAPVRSPIQDYNIDNALSDWKYFFDTYKQLKFNL